MDVAAFAPWTVALALALALCALWARIRLWQVQRATIPCHAQPAVNPNGGSAPSPANAAAEASGMRAVAAELVEKDKAESAFYRGPLEGPAANRRGPAGGSRRGPSGAALQRARRADRAPPVRE
jgi:hypothetical protein